MAKGTIAPGALPPSIVEGEGPSSSGTRRVLALFYAANFAHLGIVVPFFAPWLLARGLGPIAIGLLTGLPSLFKIVSPWLWGRWADRSGKRKGLLVFASFAAALSLAAVVGAPLTWPLVLLVASYGFMKAPLLPYTEATALEQSERLGFNYGPVRLWGSVAFIGGSLAYGVLQGRFSDDVGLLLGAACLGLAGVAATRFPQGLKSEQAGAEPTMRRSLGLVLFFVACALMQISHGAYYTFYSIRLEALGYSELVVAALWAFAVICEVVLLLRLDSWVKRWGSYAVLQGSLALAALRWLLIATVVSLPWLVLGQSLHAATYAAFHVASIRVVYRAFGSQRAKGQAMFSGMTYGVGMALGSSLAGVLFEQVGMSGLFIVSAVQALSGMVILFFVRGDGQLWRHTPAASSQAS